jgi:hypothetical protein
VPEQIQVPSNTTRERWFAPLPIAASRTGLLGGTVATVGFPDIGFNARAQSGKDARQTLFILCALAPLRLCVDFSCGTLGTRGTRPSAFVSTRVYPRLKSLAPSRLCVEMAE